MKLCCQGNFREPVGLKIGFASALPALGKWEPSTSTVLWDKLATGFFEST
jgi:hypothetical protein